MKNRTMNPVPNYEAEQAFKKGKNVLAFDQSTKQILHLNSFTNKNFLVEAFIQSEYLFYVI